MTTETKNKAIESIKNIVGSHKEDEVYGLQFLVLDLEEEGAALVLHLDSIYVCEEEGWGALEAKAIGLQETCLCCLQEMVEEMHDVRVVRTPIRDENPDEGWDWLGVYFDMPQAA